MPFESMDDFISAADKAGEVKYINGASLEQDVPVKTNAAHHPAPKVCSEARQSISIMIDHNHCMSEACQQLADLRAYPAAPHDNDLHRSASLKVTAEIFFIKALNPLSAAGRLRAACRMFHDASSTRPG